MIVDKIQFLAVTRERSQFSRGSQLLEATGPSHNMATSYFKASRRSSLTRKCLVTLLSNYVNRLGLPRKTSFVINSKSSAKSLHLCHTVKSNHRMISYRIERFSNTSRERDDTRVWIILGQLRILLTPVLGSHLRILPSTTLISKMYPSVLQSESLHIYHSFSLGCLVYSIALENYQKLCLTS